MSDHFDPYHKWLGIPPDEQPPDLYRLLGVPPFEADTDVIGNAADQRMAHLRTFQAGRYAALSQQLLNQLAAARVVLLHPEKRVQYDAQLRKELAAKAVPAHKSEPPPAPQHGTPGPPPRSRPPEPSTSERLNSLFENLSVEEQAVLGRVRRSLGRPKDAAAQYAEPRDPEAQARRRQLAVGAFIAVSVAVSLLLLGVLLARRGPKPAAETASAAGTPTGQTADRQSDRAAPPAKTDRGVLILRWPEADRVGARLTVGGLRASPARASPAHLEYKLPPGDHQVRIVRDGYLPFAEKVSVTADTKVDKTVVWRPIVESDGTGLRAEYFNGRNCEQSIFRRIDPNVQFIWGAGSPDERVPADEFSARWTGYLKAPFPGRYTLRAIIDDFMQVSIDGNVVLWGSDGTSPYIETEVELTGRPQAIKIEYWEGRSLAVACLNWLPPGDFVEQAIPSAAFFNEKSVAETTPVPESVLRPAPSGEPPALVVGRPVDVLERIDPDQHAIQGRWWFDGASLVCCREEAAVLELPCPLPEEYEVHMTVERLDGRDDFALTMAAAGQPFTVVFDGYGRTWSGLDMIDGSRFNRNEARRHGAVLDDNQPRDIRYRIQRSKVLVTADSETVIDWEADYKRCSIHQGWLEGCRGAFALGGWNSRFRVSKLELMPLAPSDEEGAHLAPEEDGPNMPNKEARSLADLLEQAEPPTNASPPDPDLGPTDNQESVELDIVTARMIKGLPPPVLLLTFDQRTFSDVGVFRFLADRSGRKHRCLVNKVNTVPGILGEAVEFLGNGESYVRIDSTPLLQGGPTAQITLAAWFRLPDEEAGGTLGAKCLNGTRKDWWFSVSSGHLGYSSEYSGGDYGLSEEVKVDTQWHHAAFVLDHVAGHLSLYFDGRRIKRDALPGKISRATDAPVYLGVCKYGSELKWVGRLVVDELVVFRAPLTDAHIDALYCYSRAGRSLDRR